MKKKIYIVVKEYHTTTGKLMISWEKVLWDEFCNGLLKHWYIERYKELKVNIHTISMFLAWKLPPYYWESNLRTFTKIMQEFDPGEFTNETMLFIQKQVWGVDKLVYFNILDDLYWEIESKKFADLLKRLWVPDDLIK